MVREAEQPPPARNTAAPVAGLGEERSSPGTSRRSHSWGLLNFNPYGLTLDVCPLEL